jgi:hypothetical protein
MLLHENGNERDDTPQRTPLYVDGDYLLGPEAGHLNITGMSGLSTKTSHALFTISSTFQTVEDKKVAALMFNVKGADLLFLDKPVEVSSEDDPELAERYERAGQRGLPREDREMYASLGLEVKPFKNLKIFAPLRYGMEGGERIVHAEGIPARKLNTLRSARGEDSCVYPVIWELGDVLPYAGYIFEPSDMDDKFRGFIEELRDRGVRTTADFYLLLDEIEDYFEAAREEGKNVSSWNGHNHMTIAKVRNRFKVLPNKCGGLLAHGRVEHGDLPRVDGPFRGQRDARRGHLAAHRGSAGPHRNERDLEDLGARRDRQARGRQAHHLRGRAQQVRPSWQLQNVVPEGHARGHLRSR